MTSTNQQSIPWPSRGLYAITPEQPQPVEELLARVEACLDGGAALLQLRQKHAPAQHLEVCARAVAQLCTQRGVPLIINDDPLLADQVGAAGVHLGRDDPDPGLVRARFPHLRLGVSCYNQMAVARTARSHASYLAFGSFFASKTKPDAVTAELGLLRDAVPLGLPLVAIGGIQADQGALLIEAGASFLAVCGAIFDAPDVAEASAAFNSLFRDPIS